MLKLSQDIVVLHLERCIVGDDLPPLDTVSFFEIVFVKILDQNDGKLLLQIPRNTQMKR